MKLQLPTIYPITDTRISGISHTDQVRCLVAGGARLIQIREKHLLPDEWFEDAQEAVRVAHSAGCRVIINDRCDFAIMTGADGVHLGQDDLPVSEARRLLGESAIIGFSTHSIGQVEAALTRPVDYIAIGPIFGTGTKADPEPVVGLGLIRSAVSQSGDIPIVAIGGIDDLRAASVLDAGAASAAIISWLISDAGSITARMAKLSIAAQ